MRILPRTLAFAFLSLSALFVAACSGGSGSSTAGPVGPVVSPGLLSIDNGTRPAPATVKVGVSGVTLERPDGTFTEDLLRGGEVPLFLSDLEGMRSQLAFATPVSVEGGDAYVAVRLLIAPGSGTVVLPDGTEGPVTVGDGVSLTLPFARPVARAELDAAMLSVVPDATGLTVQADGNGGYQLLGGFVVEVATALPFGEDFYEFVAFDPTNGEWVVEVPETPGIPDINLEFDGLTAFLLRGADSTRAELESRVLTGSLLRVAGALVSPRRIQVTEVELVSDPNANPELGLWLGRIDDIDRSAGTFELRVLAELARGRFNAQNRRTPPELDVRVLQTTEIRWSGSRGGLTFDDLDEDDLVKVQGELVDRDDVDAERVVRLASGDRRRGGRGRGRLCLEGDVRAVDATARVLRVELDDPERLPPDLRDRVVDVEVPERTPIRRDGRGRRIPLESVRAGIEVEIRVRVESGGTLRAEYVTLDD